MLRLSQLRSRWPTAKHWSLAEFMGVASRARQFFANNLTQVGYGKVAILSLGVVAPPAEVGWFAAAFTISDVIPQWSYALSGALLPVWTRLFESRRTEDMLVLRRRLLDGILFTTIPVWICLAAFAKPLCSLLGVQYIPGAPVLQIVAARSVLSVLDGFLGHGFLVAVNLVGERQKALGRCLGLLSAMSLAFGYLWGPVGVALALLMSDCCLILQYLWISSRIGLRIEWPSVVPSLGAATLMAGCAALLPSEFHFALRAIASIAVYFSALLVFSKDRVLDVGQTLRECIAP
jgi:O-antigen/teichoic acid export membrane protein